MTAILNGYEAMRDDTDPRVKEVRINHARWAFKKCTAMFNDKRENLRRWLDGEPCVFVSPVTGALIEIEIGTMNPNMRNPKLLPVGDGFGFLLLL